MSANLVTDTIKRVSLFKNHLLIPQDEETKLHLTNSNYFIAILLFTLFVLFVWLLSTNKTRLNQVIKGFYFNRFANQIIREEFSFGNRFSLFLSLIFLFSLSLFISQTLNFFKIKLFAIEYSFYFVLLCVIVCYTIKLISVLVVGNLFESQKASYEYFMTVFLFCNTLGLVLLPLVILISFAKQLSSETFIFIGFATTSIFYLVRLIRGIYIGYVAYRLPRFYLFLYLCALEILPLIILSKLFISEIKT